MTETDDLPFDYGEDAAPSDAELAQVSSTIKALLRAEKELATAEAERDRKKQTRDELAYRRLPELLRSLGYEPGDKIRMGGVDIELKGDVKAKIPVARAEEAFRWLDEHGHGGLIKRNVTIGFRRDEHEQAKRLLGSLEEYENVKEDQWIESATLKKFVREAQARGEDVPADLFGVFNFQEARIKTR